MSHPDFIKRYGRLGPRELAATRSLGDPEKEVNTCAMLADSLLIRDRHDPDSKSKYEVGRTKIFIRYVFAGSDVERRPSSFIKCLSVVERCSCLPTGLIQYMLFWMVWTCLTYKQRASLSREELSQHHTTRYLGNAGWIVSGCDKGRRQCRSGRYFDEAGLG